MENETQKSSMLEITGLWANKSKNGDTYYSGYMGKSAILIFKNNYKTEDKHPDLRMFVAEGKKKGNGVEMRGTAPIRETLSSGNIGSRGSQAGNSANPPFPEQPSERTSDIPF